MTIVFSLSLALIKNHLSYLQSKNIDAVSINKDVAQIDRDKIVSDLSSGNSTIRFLFLTPEMATLNFTIKQFIEKLIMLKLVNYFIVDEAHRVIDTNDFRCALDKLKEFRPMNENVPWIGLTTGSGHTCKEIAAALSMKNPEIIIKTSVREKVFYEVDRNLLLPQSVATYILNLKKEVNETKIPSGVIFCREIGVVIDMIKNLAKFGIASVAYYAKLQNKDENFMSWVNGDIPVLVASVESFGYGINYNVPAVRFVIHIGEPKSIHHFYQASNELKN